MAGIDVQDTAVIVTGASGIIGMEIAKMFLESGAKVSNWDLSQNDETAALLEKYPGRYFFQQLDIRDEPALEAAAARANTLLGGIDVLVNNAGVIAKEPVSALQAATLDRMYEINLRGLMMVTKHAVPYLKKSGRGRIINMSSVQAAMGMETYTPYTFTKAAVSGATRVWALELAPWGITVNAVCPGWADTVMAKNMVRSIGELHGLPDLEARQLIESYVPQQRLIKVEEIAFTVLFLASTLAGAVSATELFVDAGMSHCAKAGLNMIPAAGIG